MRIIVVHGVPCVGKSTSAIANATRHGIRTVVHTDYLREVRRSHIGPAASPVLWRLTHDAWELHWAKTEANILAGFTAHVASVAPAIMSAAEYMLLDGFDAVIEGTHFDGRTIEELRSRVPSVDVDDVLLTVEGEDDLLRRIAAKEARRAPGAEDKQWAARLEVILTIQNHLVAMSRARGGTITTAAQWWESWTG
jgi:2-phosphoglycerate kinase